MRKLIKRILIGGLGLGALIVLPLVASGQVGVTAECCRLAQNITVTDFSFGCPVVGATLPAPCNAAVTNCVFVAGARTFQKDTVIGGGDCLAATVNTCSLKGVNTNINIETQEWGTLCLLNSLYNVTNWIFYFFLAIAVLIGVIAGFLFMTAGGDPGKVDKARALLMYMSIGIVVAALAKVVPTLIRTVIGF